MESSAFSASVIVRTRDSERTLRLLMSDLRAQTVQAQLIVVDSGSTDGTLALARAGADHLIEIPPASYRPGRALNSGAAVAAGDVHFAISSHCRLPQRDWIERSLELYARDGVGATNGAARLPGGQPLDTVFWQTAVDPRAPHWGFSNHASSWLERVWRQHPFSEELESAEDKEWAIRIMESGWSIAFSPALTVDMSHRWRQGTLRFFRRERLERRVLGSYVELPGYQLRDLAIEWWRAPDPRRSVLLERVNYRRLAGLVGKYIGDREAQRAAGRR